LRDDFGFDNRSFLQALEGKGFVLPAAAANYPVTYLSVASIANMEYVVDEATPREVVRDEAVQPHGRRGQRTRAAAAQPWLHLRVFHQRPRANNDLFRC
jgi:hypothetical protein